MAWITDNELKSALKGVLGLGSAETLAGHWDELVTAGNLAGYHHVRGVLGGRGYTAAQMDTWAARTVWNRIAGLYFTLESANVDDDRALAQLDRLWNRLKDLATLTLLDSDGAVIESGTGSTANVGYGEYLDSDDDRHTMDMDL